MYSSPYLNPKYKLRTPCIYLINPQSPSRLSPHQKLQHLPGDLLTNKDPRALLHNRTLRIPQCNPPHLLITDPQCGF